MTDFLSVVSTKPLVATNPSLFPFHFKKTHVSPRKIQSASSSLIGI